MLYVGQSIYQRDYNDNTWTKLPGAAVWAAAGIDYSIWCCNASQHIFRWNATTKGWDRMPGACVQVYIFSLFHLVCLHAHVHIIIRSMPGLMIARSALTRLNNCSSTRMVAGTNSLVPVPISPLAPTARSGSSTPSRKSTACCLAKTNGNEFRAV